MPLPFNLCRPATALLAHCDALRMDGEMFSRLASFRLRCIASSALALDAICTDDSTMKELKYPVTPAIHFLRDNRVEYAPHLFNYQEKGGTAVSSRELRVPEHTVIKTLIMQTDGKEPLIVLMHGDKQVSTKELARVIGVKSISPCPPDVANRHSGYQVGGTSPFGTRRPMPVYMQESILALERIYINGGSKGFLVSLDPREAQRTLNPILVSVAIDPKSRTPS